MIDEEYWDLFDETRSIQSTHHKRGEKIPRGLYHLVVHSWIIDESGLFLISQRQCGRTDALKWERTGGSVLEGESSLSGAIREVMEELGIDVSNCPYLFIKSKKRERYHDFFDSWLFFVKRSKITLKINESEVKDFKWVSVEELEKMKQRGELVNSSLYFMEVYNLAQKKQKQ